MNNNIVSDFRIYAKDPARWCNKYQEICRFYPDEKEFENGEENSERKNT